MIRRRLGWWLGGAACLICCIPPVLAAVGATTGVAGLVGAWVGRHAAAVIVGIGAVYVAAVFIVGREATATKRRDSYDRREQ